MKKSIFASLGILILFFALDSSAHSFVIDPFECMNKLKWNRSFTRATCTMREAKVTDTEGATSVNFVLPELHGVSPIKGSIHPLSNGYRITFIAERSVSPEGIKPMLLWLLGATNTSAIQAPKGFCAKLLAETKVILKRSDYQ